MSSLAAPISEQDRIQSIDVLRGFALLGILIMNIQSFAMIEVAYFSPAQYGDLTGVNFWVWAASHALADMKFMALFSMLFGAGIILATQSRDAKGQSSLGYHYSRNLWLLIFGLIHAYLIWYGDILVTYAVAAFFLYGLRHLRAFWLFLLGALFLSLPLIMALTLPYAPPEVLAKMASDLAVTEQDIAAELAAYRGAWVDQFAARAPAAFEMQVFAIPAFLIWRAAGLMLLGMGLFKLGVFSGRRSARYYRNLAGVGLLFGLPLVGMSVVTMVQTGYDPMHSQMGPGLAYNYIGSIFMALAYLGLVMRFAQSPKAMAIKHRLAAVGRTAFTNYILQSLMCSFVFYGIGLGLFGYVERWGQLLIVFAIWALQLLIAPIWLARFRFGPLEWLWRSLTYLRLQPMRRG